MISILSILIISGSIIICGIVLGIVSILTKTKEDPLVEQVEALLPQTQCGQCSFPGCKPYAKAIVDGEAINKCPPGGQATIEAIADLLGREVVSLDKTHGSEKEKTVAYIREEECIGCTKCIQACPVDAILGAAKSMHTVIAHECTGCDLCVEPCPVDCIDMIPATHIKRTWSWPMPKLNTINNYPHEHGAWNIIASDADH